MFTDAVANTFWAKQICLGFDFDVRLFEQHRERSLKTGSQITLSTWKMPDAALVNIRVSQFCLHCIENCRSCLARTVDKAIAAGGDVELKR